MMYVRTKNGVYEVVGFNEECIIPSILIKVKNNYGKEKITHCCKGDILNKSENLEELCDCFVYFDITHKVHTVFSLEEYKKYKQDKYWTCDLHTWYGAIWTEWGLKYVAKMNENGELCLL